MMKETSAENNLINGAKSQAAAQMELLLLQLVAKEFKEKVQNVFIARTNPGY